jgi:membrane protease YdiL (CAAX protease family)
VSAAAPAEARPRDLAFLPGFLFERDPVKARYILKLWLLALIPSFALSGLVGLMAPDAEPPDLVTEGALPVLLIVAAAPIIETLIMGLVLLGLRRLLGAGPAAVASALLWAIAHSLSAPIWGLVVWWPFLVFSAAFLTWRDHGLFTAMGIVAIAHAMQNGAGLLLENLLR